MSKLLEPARKFFDACETGQGWEGCKAWCHPNATFSAQAGALASVTTLEGYCEWMKALFTPIPDAHYELKFFAADEQRSSVAAVAVFHGTQTDRAVRCRRRAGRSRRTTSTTCLSTVGSSST
jgi:predicted ester cyclase